MSHSVSDASSTDNAARLRLEGIQKKWGKPIYSSSSTSSSSSFTEKISNGAAQLVVEGIGSQTRDTSHGSRREQVEVSTKKQRLVASLFGASSSKTEKTPPPSSHKAPSGSLATVTQTILTSTESSREKTAPLTPPPDLLNLSEPAFVNTTSVDPFTQLESLIGSSPTIDSAAATSPLVDLMAHHLDASTARVGSSSNVLPLKKGSNPHNSLVKDAVARQVGVTPTGNNPNLIRNLLG